LISVIIPTLNEAARLPPLLDALAGEETAFEIIVADGGSTDGTAAIAAALAAQPRAPGGNFRLLFDGADGFSRWLEGFYAWIRARGFYYGDSGIFIRRRAYERLGGIRPIALMEDYDLVRRMEKAGGALCISEPPLLTSSRRFHGRRPAAIVTGWLLFHALYHLGVSPERLAVLYDSVRQRKPPAHEPEPLRPQSYS
jgi:glycosyltransferase involved in cell wall biosynthesis